MKITFYGHACFRITARVQMDASSPKENVSIVTDPYSKSLGLSAPSVSADIVLVSHDHAEHSHISAVKGDPFVIEGPGEYEVKGVGVVGQRGFHDAAEGDEWGVVTFYAVEAEDMRVVFLFDIGQTELTDEQLEWVGAADVLVVPVGGTWTVGPSDAVDIINQVEPRVVIPMHYALPGVDLDLASVDDFLKEVGGKADETDTLKLSVSKLPQEEMDVVVLEARGVK